MYVDYSKQRLLLQNKKYFYFLPIIRDLWKIAKNEKILNMNKLK